MPIFKRKKTNINEERYKRKKARMEQALDERSERNSYAGSRVAQFEEQNPDVVVKSATELAADLYYEADIKEGELGLRREMEEEVDARKERAREKEGHFRQPRRIHVGLLIVVLIMLSFGLIMLFSASMTNAFADYDSPMHYFVRQVLFSLMALLLMYIITRINPYRWNSKGLALIVYAVITFLLILVLIPGIGQETNGQRRWLPLYIIPELSFQPTELAKLATVYCGAVYYSNIRKLRSEGGLVARTPLRQVFKDLTYDFLIPAAAILFWFALISQQSHFSATLIISMILFVVFLGAGIRLRSWTVMLTILVSLAVLLGSLFLTFREPIESYAKQNPRLQHILVRLRVFSAQDDAEVSDDNESYQSRHALIGIGSGGLTGKGLGMGRQKFNWLPEIHNDYVFSNICEELGFVGGMSVIILFLIFFIIGISITLSTQSIYMQILAIGFSSLITIQAFLSIAVNLMVIPPTGISLPLFSYGGTSNIFFLFGIGLLLAVSKYAPKERGGIKLAAPSSWRKRFSGKGGKKSDEV